MDSTRLSEVLLAHQDALSNQSRLQAILFDVFPMEKRDVRILLIAYELGITDEISCSEIDDSLVNRLTYRLEDEFSIDSKKAREIVLLWCEAYGVGVLQKDNKIQANKIASKKSATQSTQPTQSHLENKQPISRGENTPLETHGDKKDSIRYSDSKPIPDFGKLDDDPQWAHTNDAFLYDQYRKETIRKYVAITLIVLLLGVVAFMVFHNSSQKAPSERPSVTSLTENNSLTTATATTSPTATPTAKPTATPTAKPTAAPTSDPNGPPQGIGPWFGWLFTKWLPQAIVDALKFIVVEIIWKFLIVTVIWNFLIKTVIWGLLQFLWSLLVSLWHAIFG